MLIAFILVSVYAYAITGYLFQKAEDCMGLDEKLIFGVFWPIWLMVYIYRFIYITLRVWRKRLEQEKQDKKEVKDKGPEISGMTQVKPGLYVANESYSVFDKKP